MQEKLVAVLEKLAVVYADTKPKRKRKKYYSQSYGANSNHKGKNCYNKKAGYKANVTEENKMGGSIYHFN